MKRGYRVSSRSPSRVGGVACKADRRSAGGGEPITESIGLLTVRETAEALRVGTNHVYELLASGELEKIALGPRRTRVTLRSLEAYISRMKDDADNADGCEDCRR